jgi:uncharacterized protein YacL
MQNIANAKYGIDNFNFFLRTTAGNTIVIFLMVLVNTVGYMFFFKMIFTEKIAAFNAEMANWLPYVIGFVFAIVISSGSYMAIVNGYEQLGRNLYRLSITLSICTYALMLLTNIPDFSIFKNGVERFYFGKEEMNFVFMIMAVFVLAVTPDYISKEISKEISKKYATDKYMMSLNESLEKHQDARIEYEVGKVTKGYTNDDDAAEREVEAILKSLKIKRQKV